MERVGLDPVQQLDALISGDGALLLDLLEQRCAGVVSRRAVLVKGAVPLSAFALGGVDELAEVLGVSLCLGVEAILEASGAASSGIGCAASTERPRTARQR
jgi:hypothetical protein